LLSKYHGFHVYDLLTRVPLVMTGATLPRGQVDATTRSAVDITPTILELAGLPAACDGSSLLKPQPSRPIFLEAMVSPHHDPAQLIAGVRFDDWKFACRPQASELRPELYHLKDDPFERTNRADKEPALLEQGTRLIQQHWTEPAARPAEGLSSEEEAVLAKRLQELGYIE
jgi:arylsulfatase A-like enzyme